jgi:hypothetical protein
MIKNEFGYRGSLALVIDESDSENVGVMLIIFNATTGCCRCQSDRPSPNQVSPCKRLVLSRQSAFVSHFDSHQSGGRPYLSARFLLRNTLFMTSKVDFDAA